MIAKKTNKKKSWQNLIFSLTIAFFVVLVIGFLVFSNFKISQRRAELNSRIESLKAEIKILEEKNQDLKQGINQSGSEEYLEKIARENLGLKKEGEDVVVIKGQEQATTSEAQPEEKGFWQKIWDSIIK